MGLSEPDWPEQRSTMVDIQVARRGVSLPRALQAMHTVPRHEFVPAPMRSRAYVDAALPIGDGQTISQPYIVGRMTELCDPKPGDRILEIGTGSGYQSAVLAEAGAQVFTVERLALLAERAETTLRRLGYEQKITVIVGDGFSGLPDAAPFDAVIITCAVTRVPPPLLHQLKPHARIILPLGKTLDYQELTVVTQRPGKPLEYTPVLGVVFVPMTGPNGFQAM